MRPRAFVRQFGIDYPFLLVGEPEEAPAKIRRLKNSTRFRPPSCSDAMAACARCTPVFASAATGTVHADSKRAMAAEIERLLAEKAPTTH